jgi:ribokinase
VLFRSNLVVDDIVLGDGSTRLGHPGGAVLYSALGAALWGIKVAIVAPVGDDYPAPTLAALRARGIDLSGLRPLGGPGLRSWLLYEPSARRLLPRLGTPDHATASPTPADLEAFAQARAFHLSPAPLACQLALLTALRDHRAMVSVDPFEPITEASLARWRPALALMHRLFVSAEELTLDKLADTPESALARLFGGKLEQVFLKQGANGGLCATTNGSVRWQAQQTSAVDPTGAGDAFAGGFIAATLAGADLRTALASGAVSASFAVEAWGPEGLLHATLAMAEARRAVLLGNTGA